MNAVGKPGGLALLRLAASGGRSDRLRIALTAVGAAGATITLLTAAAVAFISPENGPYELNVLDEPGLRPGVMIAMLLLTVPLLVFVGLCTRVGAPARDRRLSMFRMAGATPAETTKIAALETGVAALLGAVAGSAIYLVGRLLLDTERRGAFLVAVVDGETRSSRGLAHSLPTDVMIPVPAVIAVIALIAVGATIASMFALRSVRISPFGVTRLTPRTPPAKSAVTLFLGGTVGLMVLGSATRATEGQILPITLGAFALFVLCVAGLLLGSASMASAVGRFLAPRTSRPDLLIASRRMIAAPYTASRATASVLLAVMIGGAVQGTRENFLAGADPSDTFYADTFALLDIVLIVAIALSAANLLITSAEAIVERRRTLAALVAGGTPRPVLARAVLMESLVPLVPSVLIACAAGLMAARSLFGTTVERFPDRIAVPIPWERLATLCAGTIALSLTITALSLLFLGRSTRPSELRAAA